MSKYFTYFPKVEYLGRTVSDITRRVKIVEDLENDPYAFLPYTITDNDRPEDIAYYYYGDANKVWMVYLANQIIDPYSQWPLSSENFEKSMIAKYERPVITFANTSVNTAISTINVTSHGLHTSDPIVYTTSNTVVTGLTSGNTYYVIKASDSAIRLASSAANAIANTSITLSGVGSGTHSLTFNVDNWLINDTILTNIKHYENKADPTITISPDTYIYDTSLITSEWTKVKHYDYEFKLNDSRRTIWLVNATYADQLEADLEKVMND